MAFHIDSEKEKTRAFVLPKNSTLSRERATGAADNAGRSGAWPTYALLALAAALSAVVVTVFTRRKLDLEAQLALLQAKSHGS